MKKGNLFLGVFLIFLGIFFLLNNLNIIDFSIWATIFDLWPLFLVMLGIHLISRKQTITIISWIIFFLIIIIYTINTQGNLFNIEMFNFKNLI